MIQNYGFEISKDFEGFVINFIETTEMPLSETQLKRRLLNLNYAIISKEFQEKYFSKYLAFFPDSLEKRIKKYRRWQDAQSTLLGYLLISKELLLGDLKKISTIQYNAFNKPFLKNNSFFNVSHSGNYVVFISCKTNEIGIDIEKIDYEISVNDFFSHMTKKEQQIVETSNNKVKAFYSYWTQKEVVIKACGKGLTIPLKSFEIINNRTHLENKQYFTKEIFINSQYTCQIASTMKLDNIGINVKEIRFLENSLI